MLGDKNVSPCGRCWEVNSAIVDSFTGEVLLYENMWIFPGTKNLGRCWEVAVIARWPLLKGGRCWKVGRYRGSTWARFFPPSSNGWKALLQFERACNVKKDVKRRHDVLLTYDTIQWRQLVPAFLSTSALPTILYSLNPQSPSLKRNS